MRAANLRCILPREEALPLGLPHLGLVLLLVLEALGALNFGLRQGVPLRLEDGPALLHRRDLARSA
eukprot:15098168-Alexandrium_andersonii.AAC.1